MPRTRNFAIPNVKGKPELLKTNLSICQHNTYNIALALNHFSVMRH